MEAHLVSEFVSRTGANTSDALSCLDSWGWDLKKALIDYNDTSTTDYFNVRASTTSNEYGSEGGTRQPAAGIYRPPHHHHTAASSAIQHAPIGPQSQQPQQQRQQPSLSRGTSISDHVGLDYKKLHRGISRATDDNVHLVQTARSAIAMDFHTNGYHQPPPPPPPQQAPPPAGGANRASDPNSRRTSDDRDDTAHQALNAPPPSSQPSPLDSPDYTFTLPDISGYAADFRRFLERDLIEASALSALEQSQRLNWWTDAGYCRRLWPLATSGDGNCLLHAASLALWGFHDRRLTLRTALHGVLTADGPSGHGGQHSFCSALWRRWRFQQTRLNREAGFVYSEAEWSREWQTIVALASPEPRQTAAAAANGGSGAGDKSTKAETHVRRRSMVVDGVTRTSSSGTTGVTDAIDEHATYESLEEIHILALAHVLRRTIIVVADTVLRDMDGEAMAPIPFGGVYLPFEIPAGECHRAPLLLTYDMAHFSALVSMEVEMEQDETTASSATAEAALPSCIPLLDIDNQLLPIHFCIDPGAGFVWPEYDGAAGQWALSDREHIALLREYLDVVNVAPLGGGGNGAPDDVNGGDAVDGGVGGAEELSDYGYDDGFEGGQLQLDAASMAAVAAAFAPTSTEAESGGGDHKQSKTAKQLQSVAKQFGSIGKSMSQRIKRNIGSIAKIGHKSGSGGSGSTIKSSASFGSGGGGGGGSGGVGGSMRTRLLCAQLRAKRYAYQEEMIRNYLECAQDRFLDAERVKLQQQQQPKAVNAQANGGSIASDYTDSSTSATRPGPDPHHPSSCINAGCLNFGTAETCYMCPECFEQQRDRELGAAAAAMDPVARYGAGNSRFYTQSDRHSHAQIERIPSVKRLNELDQTLYLSNSTFFNDQREKQQQQQQQLNQQRLSEEAIEQQYLQTGFRTASSFGMPAASTTSMADSQRRPLGSASVYSPGRTIIHHVHRTQQPQTVQLPPIGSSSSNVDTVDFADSAPAPQATSSASLPRVVQHHISIQQSPVEVPAASAQTCRTDACMFFGSAASDWYCSKCSTARRHQQQSHADDRSSSSAASFSKVLTDV